MKILFSSYLETLKDLTLPKDEYTLSNFNLEEFDTVDEEDEFDEDTNISADIKMTDSEEMQEFLSARYNEMGIPFHGETDIRNLEISLSYFPSDESGYLTVENNFASFESLEALNLHIKRMGYEKDRDFDNKDEEYNEDYLWIDCLRSYQENPEEREEMHEYFCVKVELDEGEKQMFVGKLLGI